MSIENIGGTPGRGPSMAAMQKAAEHKDMLLSPLAAEYREVQIQIAQKQAALNSGNEHLIGVTDRTLREKGIEEGRKLTRELKELDEKKTELENNITTIGGNPSDYTVQ